MKLPLSFLIAALVVALAGQAASAQSAMPAASPSAPGAKTIPPNPEMPKGAAPQQLPPGMTPQLMKMMMTEGPKHPAGLPRDLVPYGGCIPSMGYHYVARKDAPFGPIYGWYKGKPVFTEIMVDTKLFASGKSWDKQLAPLPGYKIDHVDIWYEAHGHPGYPIPHYDIHAWYIPHDVHMTFCGNTSGKKPPFL